MGRHYDLYPGRHYDRVSWDVLRTRILGRHYDLVSWDAIMT